VGELRHFDDFLLEMDGRFFNETFANFLIAAFQELRDDDTLRLIVMSKILQNRAKLGGRVWRNILNGNNPNSRRNSASPILVRLLNNISAPRGYDARYDFFRSFDMNAEIDALIEAGADIDAMSSHGDTLLYVALETESPKVIEKCFQHGASMYNEKKMHPNYLFYGTRTNSDGFEFMALCANKYGQLPHIDDTNASGHTALETQLMDGYPSGNNIKVLLELGANPNVISDGESIMHKIVRTSEAPDLFWKATAIFILVEYGVNMNMKNSKGVTPLILAIRKSVGQGTGSVLVENLVDAGARIMPPGTDIVSEIEHLKAAHPRSNYPRQIERFLRPRIMREKLNTCAKVLNKDVISRIEAYYKMDEDS
jgi:ankyrin repeat protein